MKNSTITILSILYLLSHTVIAQLNKADIFTMTDGTKLEVIVNEITDSIIRYKRFKNLNGPEYIIAKDKVISIAYANGEVEIITKGQSDQTAILSNTDLGADRNSLSGKKKNFLDQYQSSEELLIAMKKYKKKSATAKIFGTILGSAGLAGLAAGIIKFSKASDKALSERSAMESATIYSQSGYYMNSRLMDYMVDNHPDVYGTLASNYENEQFWDQLLVVGMNAVYRDEKKAAQKRALPFIYGAVGALGLSTACYLSSASSGWKYRLLRSEARTKRLSLKVDPLFYFSHQENIFGLQISATF